MEEEFTYMDKFDGTNIAKDKNGCIYSRRTKLDEYVKDFIGTSLENVKKIDVKSFHELMCNLVGERVKNTIVFGELICNNNIHDYTERGVNGRWIMFGGVMVIEDDENMSEYLEKLRDNGFVVKNLKSGEICIYLNEKVANADDVSVANKSKRGFVWSED